MTIDTVIPLITWVDVVSNNAKHSQLAKAGDTVFLTINASEWIDEPTVQLATRAVDTINPYGTPPDEHDVHYLYGSSPEYNATITVVGSHVYDQETPTEAQGNVRVSISNVEDPAGVVGLDVTAK